MSAAIAAISKLAAVKTSPIAQVDSDAIWRCAAEIPEEWYEADRPSLHRLVEALYKRCPIIRTLVDELRVSTRNPFRNWKIRACPVLH